MVSRSAIFRTNAQNCRELARVTAHEADIQRYGRMAKAWEALAFEEDWLAGILALPSEPEPVPVSPRVLMCSPLRKHVADVLTRARRLPVGPSRNDLRQLASGLLALDRRGGTSATI